jgi:hypothetical protein
MAACHCRRCVCHGIVYLLLVVSFVALIICNVHMFLALPAATSSSIAESAPSAARIVSSSFDADVLVQPMRPAVVLSLDLTPAPPLDIPVADLYGAYHAPGIAQRMARLNHNRRITPPSPPPTVAPLAGVIATSVTATISGYRERPAFVGVLPTGQSVHAPSSRDGSRPGMLLNNVAVQQAHATQSVVATAEEHPTVPEVPPVSFGMVQSMDSIEGVWGFSSLLIGLVLSNT